LIVFFVLTATFIIVPLGFLYLTTQRAREPFHHALQHIWGELTWGFYVADCQKLGDTIVVALNQYKNDHGEYPDELSSLIPHYLPEIPDHFVGNKKWEYGRSYEAGEYDDVFTLTFHPSRSRCMPCCTYFSMEEKWEIQEF